MMRRQVVGQELASPRNPNLVLTRFRRLPEERERCSLARSTPVGYADTVPDLRGSTSTIDRSRFITPYSG